MANILHDLHEQAEAEFQSYGEVPIVSTFGEPQAEYAAIHKSVALLDRPERSIVELTGADRLTFLNNLVTNALIDRESKTPIPTGQCVYAFLLNAKNGRILCDLHVIELGDRTLLEMDRRMAPPVTALFARYLFAEKVAVKDLADELHSIALIGPDSFEMLADACDLPPSERLSHDAGCAMVKMNGVSIAAWRDDAMTGVPAIHLLVPTDAARSIWMSLISRFALSSDLGKRRLRPAGWAAFNTARIEAGTPLFGIDFDENTLPAETGSLLHRAVSFTKGCYPGQEVVARMHARQQLAKQIACFQMDVPALPIAGAQVFDDDRNQIGVVTSSTISPVLSGRAIGIALVKRPLFAIDSKLHIAAEGAIRTGRVVQAPFITKDQKPNEPRQISR